MIMNKDPFIGFACAYTPLALVHAAGFTPCRILPAGDCPDQAGHLLHDNLCPHVKRILDRALSRQIPDLTGMIFMNSCDAMRRLYDAWQVARPDIPCILVDLPTTVSERNIAFFFGELQRLAGVLEKWGGTRLDPEKLAASLQLFARLAGQFEKIRARVQAGDLRNGATMLQAAYLKASVTAPEPMIGELETLLSQESAGQADDGVPVYLFGNVLPETDAFALFAECGARIVGEDLCTGSRLFTEIRVDDDSPDSLPDGLLKNYAKGLLNRQPCARTMIGTRPGELAADIIRAARLSGAKGVIGHTVKFCDPYIARIPNIRAALKQEGIPFLMLEGDCTVRSIGQQKTRIEAFIEMLR